MKFLKVKSKKMIFLLCFLLISGCGQEVSILKKEASQDLVSESDTEKGEEQAEVEETQEALQKEKVSETMIYVDIGGAVKNPGVYMIPEESRMFQVVELAGGFTEDAEKNLVNQADILKDGQKIYIYTIQEAKELEEQGLLSSEQTDITGTLEQVNGKVNINLADKDTLMTLSGIGETRAEAILKFREEHGGFGNIEELMQVEGIKEKTYDKIKDSITVQ